MDAFNPVPIKVLEWMESSWLNELMLNYTWSWVICETLHFTGMCLLFGPILIMDFRLLGFDRLTVPAAAVHSLIPLTMTGFAINLITGILFCFGMPYRYSMNIGFQIKMVLVVIAGINAIWFWARASRVLEAAGPNGDPPLHLKIVGLSSLLLWIGVLCFGRLIPYLGTG